MLPKDLKPLVSILNGLIDGSHPLAPPHPQRLSYPNDKPMVEAIALVAATLIGKGHKLCADDIRHLVFKLAAWASKRGLNTPQAVMVELWENTVAIDMVLAAQRDWLTSRAGVGWCIKRFERWQADVRRIARAHAKKPALLCQVAVGGYSIVELTNARHIHAEG